MSLINSFTHLYFSRILSIYHCAPTHLPTEAGPLYAEKICHLLNFIFSYIQDMVDQLSSSRLELAQASSRLAVTEQRCDKLRLQYVVCD